MNFNNQYNNNNNKYNTTYRNSTINNMYNTNAYIQTQQVQPQKKKKNIWKIILLILSFIIFMPCACTLCLLSNVKSVTITEDDESYDFSSINEEKIPLGWDDNTEKTIAITKRGSIFGYDYKLWEHIETGSIIGVSAIDLSINDESVNDVINLSSSYDYIYEIYSNGNMWLVYYDSNNYYSEETKETTFDYDYFCFSYNEKNNCIEIVNIQESTFKTDEEVVKFLEAYDEKLTIDYFDFKKNN